MSPSQFTSRRSTPSNVGAPMRGTEESRRGEAGWAGRGLLGQLEADGLYPEHSRLDVRSGHVGGSPPSFEINRERLRPSGHRIARA